MAHSQIARVAGHRPHGLVFDKTCMICGAGRVAVRMTYDADRYPVGEPVNLYELATLACTNPACRVHDDVSKAPS